MSRLCLKLLLAGLLAVAGSMGQVQIRAALSGMVTNLGDKVALYNLLSTFSRTHLVTPRAYQGAIGFVF